VILSTSARRNPQRSRCSIALAAVVALAIAPIAAGGPRDRSGASLKAGFKPAVYGITRYQFDMRETDVPAEQGPTRGSSDPCPEGMSLLSGGVILAQQKYTGSLLASFPEKDEQGHEHWGAIVVNPGLGLGEPGQLALTVLCFRPIYAYQKHPAHLRPLTSVDAIPKERDGYIGVQEDLSGHVLCTKPAKNPRNTVGRLITVGGGFSLANTSSAAPFESHMIIVKHDFVGWVAGASNLGIGETPGVLSVDAYCLELQHGHGTPVERLFTRVVGPVHYKLPPGPSVRQHSADCPGLPFEKRRFCCLCG
jgi:hypothetical protein